MWRCVGSYNAGAVGVVRLRRHKLRQIRNNKLNETDSGFFWSDRKAALRHEGEIAFLPLDDANFQSSLNGAEVLTSDGVQDGPAFHRGDCQNSFYPQHHTTSLSTILASNARNMKAVIGSMKSSSVRDACRKIAVTLGSASGCVLKTIGKH